MGVKLCTYHNWFLPLGGPSLYHAIPMSGSRMKRFLGYRLGTHGLPVAVGRRTGVSRDDRVCPHCFGGAVGDELHMTFECAYIQPLREQYGHLFATDVHHGMREFCSQSDKVAVVNFTLQALSLMGA